MPFFAENGYSCHAFDLSGHGQRNIKGKRLKFRVRDYVRDLIEAINLFPEKPILIGHSLGGFIIQKYLEKNKAPSAVLLSTIPSSGAFLATLKTILRHPLAFLKMNIFLRLMPIISTPALAKEAFFEDDLPDESLKRYFSLLNDESYICFLDMVFLDLPKPRKNACNMLVIGVEKDRFFTPKEIINTAEAFNAEHKIFPGMSHDLMVDKNWKEPAEFILSWLDKRS